ncbi:hypothetical protein BKA58DRAFT_221402 [Alternaria rosae]|uniref:uncharacterized protein n=1 Tax=Alternaria rosae TaxID=1187941 RepID=UPI001E8E7052|nr:uncharacterized protein BKA58DRAFT_221402 [Alternaria rosae]KAH6865451.1 hypothetical protein BKA58DRAFT_221402 [Alternaria rosae]
MLDDREDMGEEQANAEPDVPEEEQQQQQEEDERGPDHPTEPDDDVPDEPLPACDADASAAADDPPPPPPVDHAAAPAAAPIPAPALTDAQRVIQEMAAITTNWGPEFRDLRDCIPAKTWLKGKTEHLTEKSCEPDTLHQLRKLSNVTRNLGKEVKKKIGLRWTGRKKKTGDIGSESDEKQRSLREDLKRIREEYTTAEDDEDEDEEPEKPTKRNANGKTPDRTTKRLRKSTQDDEDEYSSGESNIPHDGPGAESKLKGKGKDKATEVPSDDTEAIPSTHGQRDLALGQIYHNWEMASDEPLVRFLPALLLPPDMTDESLIDGRILARLRDLSNVTAGQRVFVQEALLSEMADFMGENVERVLDLLARVRVQIQETIRVLERASEEARAGEQAVGPSRGALLPTLGAARPSIYDAMGGGDGPLGQPMLLTEDERARARRARELYPPTAPPLPNRLFQASQARTQPAAQPGLSRFESGVLIIGSSWTLRRALDDSRQADQCIQTARRRYEQAVLNGQSVQDQAALLLGIEAARGVSDEVYARTDALQGRWVGARSTRSMRGDGLGGLTGDFGLGRRAQAEGASEEECGDGQQGGDGENGGGLGEGTKKTKKKPKN